MRRLRGYDPPAISAIPQRLTIHSGWSMYPVLRPLDRLELVPYDGHGLRCGDVVAIRLPEDDRIVTHRIVEFGPDGIRTRGDNNRSPDPSPVATEAIVGVVVAAERGGRRFRVHGGLAGRVIAGAVRIRRVLRLVALPVFRPIYHGLAWSGVFRLWRPSVLRLHVIAYHRPDGKELQLLRGGEVVGRRRPGQGWEIRAPYRLFVSEASLADDGGDGDSTSARHE